MSDKLEYGLSFVDLDHNFDEKKSDGTYYRKNTLSDFDLRMTELYIPEPKTKRSTIDIPFSSGSLDITEASGVTPYKDREGLEFKFFLNDPNPERWGVVIRNLSMYLHGKKLKMMTEYDQAYYYVVRLEVDAQKSNKKASTVVLKGTAEPFKYDIVASNEPWKWDPFSFVDGVIEVTLSDLKINGSKDVTIPAGGLPASPTFYVYQSTNLKVIYKDVAYSLNRDSSAKAYNTFRFPQIKVGSEPVTLRFTGYGTISIEYRGRYL